MSEDSVPSLETELRAPGLPVIILHSPQRRLSARPQSLPHGSSGFLLLRPSLHSVSQAPRHCGGKVGRGSSGSRTVALLAVVATAAAAAATLPGNGRGGGRDPNASAMLTANRHRVLRDGYQGVGAGRQRQPIGGADYRFLPPTPLSSLWAAAGNPSILRDASLRRNAELTCSSEPDSVLPPFL